MSPSSHDIIVIGASAGGVEALRTIMSGLPEDLPAAVFVVMHFPAHEISYLPDILNRAGPVPAAQARDREPIEPGRIYLARPDFHLLVESDHVHLVRGPKENRSRPAIDPLFRSAALVHGPRVIGVILTGMLDDGTAGLYDVKLRGGATIVQDPRDADFPSMPRNALRYVQTPHCVPVGEIAPLLSRLSREPAEDQDRCPAPEGMRLEAAIAAMEANTMDTLNRLGSPSGFACPECHGPLWRLDRGNFPRFRCHTGHAYGPASLLEAQAQSTEEGLWQVLRSTDERIELMREMRRRSIEDDGLPAAGRWDDQILHLEGLSARVRESLASGNGGKRSNGGSNGSRPTKPRKAGPGRKSRSA